MTECIIMKTVGYQKSFCCLSHLCSICRLFYIQAEHSL